LPTAWRIVKRKLARSAFDGEGARLYGGRWTRVGRRAVYTSSSVSLATLEIVAHLDYNRSLIENQYSLFKVDISEDLVLDADISSLRGRWMISPPPPELCAVGDAWLNEKRKPVLRVPSAIVFSESNYLLDPKHPDFSRLVIGEERAYSLDPRLLR